MNSMIELTGTFSAAHFYCQPKWSKEKNETVFGRCFTPEGHGHNYKCEVSFLAPPEIQSLEDLESWAELETLKAALFEETDRMDHAHLNFVIPEFKTLIPTTENIAKVLMERLQARNLPWPPVRLRLYEMDDLWVEIESEPLP